MAWYSNDSRTERANNSANGLFKTVFKSATDIVFPKVYEIIFEPASDVIFEESTDVVLEKATDVVLEKAADVVLEKVTNVIFPKVYEIIFPPVCEIVPASGLRQSVSILLLQTACCDSRNSKCSGKDSLSCEFHG